MNIKNRCIATLLFLLLTSTCSAEAIFYYTSSPGSWVGQGETVYLTDSDPFNFTVGRLFDNGISIMVNDYAINPITQDQRFWQLAFSGAHDEALAPGLYSDAARHPFNEPGTPGLDITGNHRGNNTLSGWFRILEIEYGDPDGIFNLPGIEVLAIDFVQYDEGIEGNRIAGSFRLNSGIPITQVPVPGALGLFGSCIVLLLTARRSRQSRKPLFR